MRLFQKIAGLITIVLIQFVSNVASGQCSPPSNQGANPQIVSADANHAMIVGVPTKVAFRFINSGDSEIGDDIPPNTVRIQISISTLRYQFVAPYIAKGCGVWAVDTDPAFPSSAGVINLINSGGTTPGAYATGSSGFCDIEFWVMAKRANPTPANYNVNVMRIDATASCVGDAQDDDNSSFASLQGFFGPAPDINATYVNVPVSGNVSTNDKPAPNTTYGTPVALPGNPAGAITTLTMGSDGKYNFSADKVGVYNYEVPVCVPGIPDPVCTMSLLTITVTGPTPVSVTPAAHTDIATTIETTPVVLKTLINDNSMDPAHPLVPSSVTITDPPNNGTAIVNPATGDITYTANPGFYGKDTLFYQVCDNNGPPKCATAMQIITVLPGNDNLIIASDDYSKTTKDVTVSGNAITNDINPEAGQTITVTPQGSSSSPIVVPNVGSYFINSDGSYTFDPLPDFVGSFNFPYEVCDNQGACAKATVYITVNNPGNMTVTPIGVQNFKAAWAGAWGKLTWKGTGIETAGTYYGIERSIDGTNYTLIGKVDAIPGTEANYNYFDKEVESGFFNNKQIYYRLKLVDTDGTYKYSNIERISKSDRFAIQVYPNPATSFVRFNSLEGVSSIELKTTTGQLVQSFSNVNPTKLEYNLRDLPAAMYVLTLKMKDSNTQSFKLEIRK